MDLSDSSFDPSFAGRVASTSGGESLHACFACGTCTAGCPVREADERYNPRKIIRMTLLGMKERVLSSDFVWLCSSCYTCQERCPQDVRIADLMTALRNIAAAEGRVHPSYVEQLRLIKEQGRLYEITDFDNKKRAKMALPELPLTLEEPAKLIEATGIEKKVK
jgi:heterodisulfide reductase subunit C